MMDPQEILRFCLKNGLLIDKDILKILSETPDIESAKLLLDRFKNKTQQKVLTKNVFEQNKDQVHKIILELPEENQKKLESFKIKLGLELEIPKEVATELIKEQNKREEEEDVKIVDMPPALSKKLEVKDFVKYFRGRLSQMKGVLQERGELTNLVSIDKISGNRQGVSIIGLVADKRTTKNKNIIFEIEDLTGRIKVLVNANKPEVYEKAEEVPLDSVIGIKGSGSREILFVNDLVFPDSHVPERRKGNVDEYALFIGDTHVGSKLFLENNFLKFIDYLNGKVPDTPEVEKIRYLFFIGDCIAGVGIYPDQEKDLVIPDVEGQYAKFAELIGKIRNDIKIIICPGNHDAMRIMEPQPVLDEKYAWPLYNLKNVTLVGNPCTVNFGAKKEFSGFNVLMYHGFSYIHYANSVPRLMKEKAINQPEMIIEYLLKYRHLAPTHSSTLYFPSEKDPFFLENVPDIIFSGHIHKGGITYHNNILVICGSTWENITPLQEKVGNKPDFCKVPMFNLRTRAVKILDFE